MSQDDVNEQTRNNYAIEAYTMGEDHLLKLFCGGECIVTICTPAEPHISQFIVYNQDGLDEDDVEDPNLVVKRFPVRTSVNDAWREAVRFGYAHALSRMMVVDKRRDRELEELAA